MTTLKGGGPKQRLGRLVRRWRGHQGFTLIELMIVVGVIGILAAIAIPVYSATQAQARMTKARADLRALATAVSLYQAHAGNLPAAVTDLLTIVTNTQGYTAGPFIAVVPSPPPGGSPTWTSYTAGYVANANGTFSLSATGDGVSVVVP